MTRRQLLALAATSPVFAQTFTPDWTSLQSHPLPSWFDDAKLGIFIHWGLYSVPAWAPPTGELGKVDWSKWFYQNPYAEWYLNSLRLSSSPTAQHHAATFGPSFDYYSFASAFESMNQSWRPAEWAGLFKATGARYVVLTTKHHDGYTLWPSQVPNPVRPQGRLNSRRDLVGELTRAVRTAGMKMGLYYSGGLDWTFESRPITSLKDLRANIPQSESYAHYADAHWRELIRLYQPSVLWNDIGFPKLANVAQLFADYYKAVPEGVVNNRFDAPFADFTTPEYAKYDKITPKKWESCRGLGFSFGHNQAEGPEHVIASDKLIALLIDIVAKNGNLLLNIGPRPDGSIPALQLDRLQALGAFMKEHGEALVGSRPFSRPSSGENIRFTRQGNSLDVWFLSPPATPSVQLPGLQAHASTRTSVQWTQNEDSLVLQVTPETRVVRLTPAPRDTLKTG
jgi:alpha-L-fucosidase